MSQQKVMLAGVGFLFAVGSLLSGCAESTGGQEPHALAMASLPEMPMDVQQAPVAVQEAYQFAVGLMQTTVMLLPKLYLQIKNNK